MPEMISGQQNFACTKRNILNNGQIIENQDGSVSVFKPNNLNILAPVQIGELCCTNLGYTYDIEKQKCMWASDSCDISNEYKIVINSNGDDGTVFEQNFNETCLLNINFDFLIKVKCETLMGLLTEETQNTSTINNILEQIQAQEAICEDLNNQLVTLSAQINTTNYSIICESAPQNVVSSRVSSSLLTDVFASSAFKTPTEAPTIQMVSSVAPENIGVTYCISEPSGLNTWLNILGQNKYDDFINGDPYSYTCDDLQSLIDANQLIIDEDQDAIPLIFDCTTPFGTKTQMLIEFKTLNKSLENCQKTLEELNNELNNLISNGVDVCQRPLSLFETMSLTLIVDTVDTDNNITTIYTDDTLFPEIGLGNLYRYITNNENTGFYVCGGDDCTPFILESNEDNQLTCNTVVENILNDLYFESGLSALTNGVTQFNQSFSKSALTSNWLNFTTTISDPEIISQMINKKVKFSILLSNPCAEISILLDNIEMEKSCEFVKREDLLVTKNPGFELERIIDNKKAWLSNTVLEDRAFEITKVNNTKPYRWTNYDVDNEKLIINTKEIDLDISLASALETDVWCYVNDNPCILSAKTTCDPCSDCLYKSFQDDSCFEFQDTNPYEFMDGDYTGSTYTNNCCGDNALNFNELLTHPITGLTTIEEFINIITSELIDAKNRKTISQYATLKALYDRYLNSDFYCGTNSSAFNYMSMEQFSKLLGNYWVDIIEQVVPATTIWDSTKVYSNTVFDQQKFKYKNYTSFFCNDEMANIQVSNPIGGSIHQYKDVSIELFSINKRDNDYELKIEPKNKTFCNVIYITQMNNGSDFVGSVKIINSNT
jgi:hypothetical protein